MGLFLLSVNEIETTGKLLIILKELYYKNNSKHVSPRKIDKILSNMAPTQIMNRTKIGKILAHIYDEGGLGLHSYGGRGGRVYNINIDVIETMLEKIEENGISVFYKNYKKRQYEKYGKEYKNDLDLHVH